MSFVVAPTRNASGQRIMKISEYGDGHRGRDDHRRHVCLSKRPTDFFSVSE